ncbi:hypothetical protein R69927_00149 [Paraburkholderia domus]|uniref:DUF1254 domain-containing protein n=1 Tax=Paraburkholderia domus TaxID=2793075 RepID=UPI001B097D9C|nr:DUF1254 domain-containing protein [Paraburkholderia domus]MBK5047614.1 DUF1254 domain-containing protein [Burkholderia sp. R-70006]MBK5084893.1 DUF1254 domain-containing protein [Burkholderia sp. R-69927]CAE6686956.1 hypothetical protein R70006_00138 [Paraburkholderia domus]CAE6810220.1 hypothetical protein R69927_00149 [Paraburkholderia domus]CAE6925235.1 hypothetical protein R75471_04415 [Paraburkholderia domus]
MTFLERLQIGAVVAGLSLTMLPATQAAAQAAASSATVTVSPEEARAIAKDAYLYAYPMLFNYKTLYQQAVDPGSKAYVGGFDKFRHYSQPYGPDNKEIVTPNNDTPYSWAWLDLRREPLILSVPAVPKDRYYSFQCVDMYTYNFAYIGSRATGSEAGRYLFAGPNWHGETPKGIDKVIRSESDLILVLGRTVLNGSSDVKNVQAIQKQYKLTPLSTFEHTGAPPPSPKINFPKWDEAKATSVDFIAYLNFLLQFTQPPAPSEAELMQRFGKIGIAPGALFDPAALPPETRVALEAGVADGKAALADAEKHTTGSFDLFGTREQMKDDYVKRAVAAAMGIYGNTKEEAVYVGTHVNGEHEQLVGTQPYVLHFDKKDLPPAKFFWSMTLYDLPARHLVANPINRYSIGDRTKGLKYGADGSLDIYVQNTSPGAEKTSNWLPAPAGAYDLITRIYGPDQAVLDGSWKFPEPQKR